ncbi:transcription elongation factor GreA [Anaerotruncus sp. CAG:390]|nr:transcription elongation factor GreA [Anaerotruncus sp. CAG:390]
MSKEQKLTFTQQGYNEMIAELDYLKNVRRAEVVHEIEVARSFGDLSENSEYDEARTEQAKVEARIKELEEKVNNAIIIDESKIDLSVISVGSTVKGYNVTDDEEFEYSLVGSNEADPMNGRISDLAPVGKALIGKRAGDTVTVETPGGELKLEVKEVSRTKSHE